MTEMATIEQKMRRTVQVRAAFLMARERLGLRGNLLTLILSSLFLLIVAFATYFIADLLAFVLESALVAPGALPDLAFFVTLGLLVIFFVLPLAVRAFRLAAAMAKGETPGARDMLCYMDTPVQYFDAVARGILCVVSVAIPVVLAGVMLLVARLVSTEILASALAADVAVQRVVAVYGIATLLALLALLLEGIALPVIFELLCGEKLYPFAAILHGWRLGAHHFGKNLLFLWSFVWRLLLGLCTLGVLWLLWFSPLLTVAYAGYCKDVLNEQ